MPIQLHRGRIDAGIQPPADQLAGNAVERLGDLHMPIRRDRASAARRAEAPIQIRGSCRPGATPPQSPSTSSCGPNSRRCGVGLIAGWAVVTGASSAFARVSSAAQYAADQVASVRFKSQLDLE